MSPTTRGRAKEGSRSPRGTPGKRRKQRRQRRQKNRKILKNPRPKATPPQRKPLRKLPANPRNPVTKPVTRPATKTARFLRADKIYQRLEATYPDAKCALNFSNPLQLLIA